MSQRQWTDAIIEGRVKDAKRVWQKLQSIGWAKLSRHDRKMMEALGYMCLQRDDINLERMCEADLSEIEVPEDED